MQELIMYFKNPLNDTGVLLVITMLDTILGVSWRVAKNQPILSNLFMSGLIKNFGCSCLPSLLALLSFHNPDKTLVDFIVPFFALAIFCGLAQSVMANAVLCGVKIPTWLQAFYDKFILNEQLQKEKKDVDK